MLRTLRLQGYKVFQIVVRSGGGGGRVRRFYLEGSFLPGERNKEYEIRTKMEQKQWRQLKMLFLLGYNGGRGSWILVVGEKNLGSLLGVFFNVGGGGGRRHMTKLLAGGRGASHHPPSRENSAIPDTKLGRKTQQNYNRLNYKMYLLQSCNHTQEQKIPYFQNKVKNLYKYINNPQLSTVPKRLRPYWSDSCRRYKLKGVCWCVDGDVGS